MRVFYLVLSLVFAAVFSMATSNGAVAQESQGKNCRMEQQCHWKDFKKICVWVKVCR
jgi:hypothetical protein